MGSNNLPEDYLRIAKCGRVVGLKGEIALWPISNVEQRFSVGAVFFLEDEKSLSIEKLRLKKDHYIVKFDGLNTREEVEGLTNQLLFAPPLDQDELDEGEFFVHDCVGKNLVDQDGNSRGVAKKFIPNAASDLLENDEGILIPFRFIVQVDDQNVYLDVPEGLFEVDDKDYS